MLRPIHYLRVFAAFIAMLCAIVLPVFLFSPEQFSVMQVVHGLAFSFAWGLGFSPWLAYSVTALLWLLWGLGLVTLLDWIARKFITAFHL
ncbi:hypothetical protein VST7929_01377 [Vibrio stylophorae]|uniref:Uncharacterized protein n=1 Tax=Vibrio stylophorae TaxID=659351 RepID=A0ABN8DS66_9VIBR|nr:hypothetical protein [Vibrio stylophorae]CAH0533507.1 hypothetical protein VST7929_01377 [Vibrio stylophorae]